ncbi:MAG: 5-(carboxyamino)imidazole ribonucleotide synthase [Bacteriodetes bacterium]|nr:5-(carboxyamino)imidazole ribonucleotide synthase [Bacteroidota bacterium]
MLPSIYHSQQPLTVGILGGGQLAKMLAQSAYKMGLRVAVIEHGADSPAGVMTKHEFTRGWNDEEELQEFIRVSDIVTLENEFIAPEILYKIAEHRLVFPAPETVALVQDKYTQKQTMANAGIPTPHFAACNSVEEITEFAAAHNFPIVIKTRKFGYDGYGNHTARNANECAVAWNKFMGGEEPRPVMAESFVNFIKELAVIVARNRRGEIAVYPCVQTIQQNHICVTVLAPAPIEQHIQQRAQEIAVACVEAINGVGVFGVELFLTQDDDIIFNEIAPRPHNSGHYTIEGCHTSQFENGIRAVCNLPLGSPELVGGAAAMINLLGERRGDGVPDSVVDFLKHPYASLHLYGKKESRIGRKMGHVTAVGQTVNEAFARARDAVEALIW